MTENKLLALKPGDKVRLIGAYHTTFGRDCVVKRHDKYWSINAKKVRPIVVVWSNTRGDVELAAEEIEKVL